MSRIDGFGRYVACLNKPLKLLRFSTEVSIDLLTYALRYFYQSSNGEVTSVRT